MNPASLTAVADLLAQVAHALPSTLKVTIEDALGGPVVDVFVPHASHKRALLDTATTLGRPASEHDPIAGWALWHGNPQLVIRWSVDPTVTGGAA